MKDKIISIQFLPKSSQDHSKEYSALETQTPSRKVHDRLRPQSWNNAEGAAFFYVCGRRIPSTFNLEQFQNYVLKKQGCIGYSHFGLGKTK